MFNTRRLLKGIALAGLLCLGLLPADAAEADTRRTLSALQSIYADNATGDISPQDLRDGILSTYCNCENVLNHGAAGDGVADDQPEIQAAIDAAGTDGVVRIPSGTYLLTAGGLTVSNNNVTLHLDRGATIKLNTDATMVNVSGDNVSVFGGVWDTNNAQTGSKKLFVVSGDEFLIENTELIGNDGQSVNLSGSSRSIIRGNRITNDSASPIFISASASTHARDNLIAGNYLFETSGGNAGTVTVHSTNAGFDVSGTRIVDNHMEYSSNFGVEVGAFSGDVPTNVIVADNYILATGSNFGGISMASVSDSQVTGNIIDSSAFAVTIGGIEGAKVNRVIIDGNYVKLAASSTHGITIGDPGLGNDNNDNIVSNNIVDGFGNTNSNKGGIKVTSSNGGNILRTIVTGNIVRFHTTTNAGQVYDGIAVFSNHASAVITDTIIANNIIFGNGDTAINGILVSENSGNLDRTSILDNIITNSDDGIKLGATVTNTFMRHNRFSDVTNEFPSQGDASNIYIPVKDPKAQAFVANDLTPDISGGELFTTLNDTSTRIITMLDGGVDGDVVRIIIKDAFTEIDFTATNLKGNGGANWSPVADDHMTCVFDATDWFCDISDNSV